MTGDRLRHLALGAGLCALAGMAVATLLDPRAAAAAWLFTLILATSLTAGAVSLLLTAKLTGGVWAEALAPALVPLARVAPLCGIAFIPLFFFLAALYPWAASGPEHASVGAYYLNPAFLAVRLAIAFAGWGLLAWLVVPLRGAVGQVASGVGLVFHIVMTTALAYDWLLALQPAVTSSVFGAHVAILFLLSALAFGALFSRLRPHKAAKDVAGLIIAAMLGTIYLDFMQYLIIWYGDLSDTAKFYLDRTGPAPTAALIAALVVGGIVPLALLLPEARRSDPRAVRAASALVLVGIALHWGWCVFALFAPAALATMPAALVLAGACAVLAWRGVGAPGLLPESAHT